MTHTGLLMEGVRKNGAMVYWVIEMETNVQPPWVSRYSVACPVCAAKFRPSSASKGITKFNCPECEELLEYVPRNDWLFLLLSMAGGIALTIHRGYSGFTFAFWAIVATWSILFVAVGVAYHIRPPQVQQCSMSLRLMDKRHR